MVSRDLLTFAALVLTTSHETLLANLEDRGKFKFLHIAKAFKMPYWSFRERGVFLGLNGMKAPAENPFPIFITSKEAASLINCSTKYLQNLVGDRRGPPCYKLGKRLRFKKSDLLQWMDTRRVNPKPSPIR